MGRLPGVGERRSRSAQPAPNRTPTSAKATAGGNPKGKEERSPHAIVYDRNPNDRWQTFIDHARSGPIPNMCLRWHLNEVCNKLHQNAKFIVSEYIYLVCT